MSKPKSDWPIFRWDFIEKIAANELSKLVGAIPIVGYLILFNDSLVSSLSFDKIAGQNSESDTPFFLGTIVKLRLAFFGSLFVLFANIVFRLVAPKVLSYAKTDIEFSDTVVDSYSVSEIHQIEKDLFSEPRCTRTELFAYECSLEKRGKLAKKPRLQGIRDRSFQIANHVDYIRAMAREWWTNEMHAYRFWRVVSLLACVFGYVMLALPTLDIAQAVVRDLF